MTQGIKVTGTVHLLHLHCTAPTPFTRHTAPHAVSDSHTRPRTYLPAPHARGRRRRCTSATETSMRISHDASPDGPWLGAETLPLPADALLCLSSIPQIPHVGRCTSVWVAALARCDFSATPSALCATMLCHCFRCFRLSAPSRPRRHMVATTHIVLAATATTHNATLPPVRTRPASFPAHKRTS